MHISKTILACTLLFLAPLLSAQLPGGHSPLGAPPPETVIESDHLEMVSTDVQNFFVFKENVRVIGNNLQVICDRLEVTTTRTDQNQDATVGEIGSIEIIIATGNVEIIQDGRRAYAGKAEVMPVEGKVVLSDNPRVIDDGVQVTGWKMTMLKDQRTVQVENDPSSPRERRPTVRLDALPDLGYDREQSRDQPVSREDP